jgi:hypothetical protein
MTFEKRSAAILEMTDELNCTHFTFVDGVMCRFCGRLQCVLCLKQHEIQHAKSGDKELQPEDLK